jgi:hypothetical protein
MEAASASACASAAFCAPSLLTLSALVVQRPEDKAQRSFFSAPLRDIVVALAPMDENATVRSKDCSLPVCRHPVHSFLGKIQFVDLRFEFLQCIVFDYIRRQDFDSRFK